MMVRFDDSLATVLAGDTDSAFGATAAWRQIVDLIGRRRAAPTPAALDRLRAIRGTVPVAARAASAHALAFSSPGPELVALFAEEELAVAAPVLRTASLSGTDWVALLPELSPAGRSVLRHRRDLPAEAIRALESFGATDFVLDYAPGAVGPEAVPLSPVDTAAPAPPPSVIVAALRQAGPTEPLLPDDLAADPPTTRNGFPISDLVARIEAFQRERERDPLIPSGPTAEEGQGAPLAFSFETDAAGTIRWAEGVTRAALVGLSLATPGLAVDGVASGAFRRRAPFRDARFAVDGTSDAAGAWRIAATPSFDPASGRFIGYQGTGRRPRYDESASPAGGETVVADSLRQLVHELRTPTNAIAGFAELIERELLGPAPEPYRARAGAIRARAADLIAAIDDLDTAARIEGRALDLRAGPVPIAPLLARVVADCQPLARLRGALVSLTPVPPTLVLDVDDRAAERLIGRLLAALVSACTPGERLSVAAMRDEGGRVLAIVDRPAALSALAPDGPLPADAEHEAAAPGAPLLGVGFALRLARNLAASLGGSLAFEPRRLTLCLPAAVSDDMGQTYAS